MAAVKCETLLIQLAKPYGNNAVLTGAGGTPQTPAHHRFEVPRSPGQIGLRQFFLHEATRRLLKPNAHCLIALIVAAGDKTR